VVKREYWEMGEVFIAPAILKMEVKDELPKEIATLGEEGEDGIRK
jgi:hypothetical protein